jgi:site-specific DNA-methyltransferase (adenine-specific)
MIQVNNIYFGDCLDIMKEIDDKSLDMILCDLPYGTTQNKWDIIIPFAPLWKEYERIIKDKGAIVLTASQPFTSQLVMSNPDLFKYELIWEKTISSNQLNATHQPLRTHENILVFYKKKPTYNPQFENGTPYSIKRRVTYNGRGYGEQKDTTKINDGYRYPKSVLKIPNPRIKGGHPTQKPVPLFEYLIKTYTNERDIVLDSCIGSGTTAIACMNTNRNFIGIEKDEEYFKIAKENISKYNECS